MASKLEILIENIVNELIEEPYELIDVEYVKEGSLKYLRIYKKNLARSITI